MKKDLGRDRRKEVKEFIELEKPFIKVEKPFYFEPCDVDEGKKVSSGISESAELPTRKINMIKPMMILTPEEEIKVSETTQFLGISPSDYPTIYKAAEMVRELNIQGKLCKTTKTVETKSSMLNFSLKLLKVINKIIDMQEGRENVEVEYSIEVTVTQKNGTKKNYFGDVPSDKVKDFGWLKKVTHSNASIPSDKAEKQAFMNMVQDCIEQDNVPIEIIYPCSGWRKLSNQSYGYVIYQGIIGKDFPLVHTSGQYRLDYKVEEIGKKETFLKAIKMMDICRDKRASSEIFIFCHASFLTTLFEQSGYPIKFVFGLLGTTNSRKTSMAITMTKLFNRDKLIADAEFLSTGCGIEKTLKTYGDSIVLIDDFKPAPTLEKQRALDEKLEQLVRLYGDRVEKRRMTDFTANGKNIFFPIRGACIMTGELISGVESSLSRMFLTQIGRADVDNDILAFYQKNISILPSHAYDFIAWVTDNYEDVKSYIRQRFNILRGDFAFSFPRYCEMYATMQTTAEIIMQYGIHRNFWSKAEGSEFAQSMQGIVVNEIRTMEEMMKARDKSLLPLLALTESIQNRRIAPVELSSGSAPNKARLYENETTYFIRMEALKDIIIEYCKTHHEVLANCSTEAILSWLLQQEVLEVHMRNGRSENSRKLPIQNGNALRYLYINKNKLKEILEVVG